MRERRRGVFVGWFIAVGLCGVLRIVGGGSSRAEDADAKPAKGNDPKAVEVLRRATDLIKKSKSIQVDLDRAQRMGPAKMEMTFKVAIERPNRFAIRSTGAGFEIAVVSDGKKLFTSVPALKKYTEAESPESLEALGGDPIIRGALQSMMIQAICAPDPYEKVMEGVNSLAYAGVETRDDAKEHHLKFAQDQFDWEMWVAADGDPVVRRVSVDLSRALANQPGAERFKGQKLELAETLSHWKLDREIDKDTFEFQPPKGSEKVDSLMPKQDDEKKPSPLLGEPAPDVNLKRLDKGEFRLEDQRDKNFVMLDFWATWCGPCVMEMPILAEVAESYKDKGVVLCAVNQREEREEIEEFLKKKKLKITVALDSKGEVGEAYGVQGIPTLVLIDKKGVVQSVHVGYSPAIKATLKKELDALLSGKDLAKEALSKVKKGKPVAAPEEEKP